MTGIIKIATTLIGFALLVLTFVSKYSEQPWQLSFILLAGAVLALAYAAFSAHYTSRVRHLAIAGLVVLATFALLVVSVWQMLIRMNPSSTIILVAKFENRSSPNGPDYGSWVRDALNAMPSTLDPDRRQEGWFRHLEITARDTLALGSNCGNATICAIPLNETIESNERYPNASLYASHVGKVRHASIVVWGHAYAPNNNEVDVQPTADIIQSFRLDRAGNLTSPDGTCDRATGMQRGEGSVSNLEPIVLSGSNSSDSAITEAMSKEFAYLAAGLVGLARYNASDYAGADDSLTQAIQAEKGLISTTASSSGSHKPKLAIDLDLLYYYRSDARARLNHPADALTDINDAVAINDKCVLNLVNQGVAYFNAGRIKEALSSFAQARRQKPRESTIAAFNYALVEETALGDLESAYKTYTEVMSRRPIEIWDWRSVADAAERVGRYDVACHTLAGAVDLEPNQPDIIEKYADCLYHRGDKKALREYERALVLDENNDDIRYSAALAYNTDGDSSRANTYFKALLVGGPSGQGHLPPSDLEAADLSRALAAQQLQYDDAIDKYAQIISTYRTQHPFTAMRERSYLNAQAGRYLDAANDLSDVVANLKTNEGDLVNEAGALAKAGKGTEAHLLFQKLLNIPVVANDYKARDSRGAADIDLGMYDQAVDEYNKATNINADDGYAYLFLAYAENLLGRKAKAEEDFKNANHSLPYDPTIGVDRPRKSRDNATLERVAEAYVRSGELYRRLGLSPDDDRIQQ